jgi:hypothetical protein
MKTQTIELAELYKALIHGRRCNEVDRPGHRIGIPRAATALAGAHKGAPISSCPANSFQALSFHNLTHTLARCWPFRPGGPEPQPGKVGC